MFDKYFLNQEPQKKILPVALKNFRCNLRRNVPTGSWNYWELV